MENTLLGFGDSFSWTIIRHTKETLTSQYPEHSTTEGAGMGAEPVNERTDLDGLDLRSTLHLDANKLTSVRVISTLTGTKIHG